MAGRRFFLIPDPRPLIPNLRSLPAQQRLNFAQMVIAVQRPVEAEKSR
jgi:hypothetical protein